MSRRLGTEAATPAAMAAYSSVSAGESLVNHEDDDDEPKSHWLKVPLSKTSALSVTENFVKKSNWFRSKKQKQLLEQMAQPQPITGNIYRYMAALVNVATGQDTVPSSNPDSSAGCCSTCCGCCDCKKCCRSSWARLTPGSILTVMMIQLLSPVSICYSHVKRLDWETTHFGLGQESGVEFWLGRCLAALFLFGFAGFLRVHLGEEIHADRKMRLLIMKDVRLGQLMGRARHWMTVGRIMNFSVSFFCLIAMWLVFHVSSDPKDVVYDSMGLAFIIKLDNVAGDMGVIGPAQWDEDVLGIYWTLVMGSAASEKHEKEERTEAHEVSATIRNLLMTKAVKIYNQKMKHEAKPDDRRHKEARLPDRSWDDMTWFVPDPEEGQANFNEVFHHPAVQEYVQSEDFVNYLYSKLGNERAIADQMGLGFIRLFQYVGPITFFFIQIRRKA
ncbi:unnamed protein product [Effrenium voratum]|uniref:Uncharacterized protein n=1 Tax=Effrenium voratum TaxID=2562239 RepID=A0AA36N1G7_9DINO|nr:unnamed protein product [Effrenium voratum]CAJ1422684.1 unnamed protein product [Effrenium voratum]